MAPASMVQQGQCGRVETCKIVFLGDTSYFLLRTLCCRM